MDEVRATTASGAEVVLDRAAVERLSSRLRGELLLPDSAGYEDARHVWNGMFDRRPALIARCATADDVAEAVTFAHRHGLQLAVRGGGHNVAGTATTSGGLLVDLSPLRTIEVDPGRRTVSAGGGVTIADLDAATQVFGLAVPMGVVSKTGIAGLTLGGGLGWLRRKWGLSADNLVAAEVVTAEGRRVTANGAEAPDLLWGLRGGGGNFGAVTSFEYRLHPVGPEVMFCFVVYPGARSAEVLRFLAAYAEEAPDEVSPTAIIGRIPPGDPFPADRQGEPFVSLAALYAGDPAEGERVLAPLRELGDPILDLSGRTLYTRAQAMGDGLYPDRARYYWRSQHLRGLGEQEISRIVDYAAAAPSDQSTVSLYCLGGAMSRVDAGATAYGDRSAPYLFSFEAGWQDPNDDERNVTWAKDRAADLHQLSGGSQYLNIAGFYEDGDATVRDAFGANYGRLTALKHSYDPGNLFRLNQNVKPAVN